MNGIQEARGASPERRLIEMRNMARDKAYDWIANRFDYLHKIEIVSCLREDSWYNVTAKFVKLIRQEELDKYIPGDYIYKWYEKKLQITFENGKPVVLGYGKTIELTDWKVGADY